MHPAQSRRQRHERARESGEALTVHRHGKPIGSIQWRNEGYGGGWYAVADGVTVDEYPLGCWRDPVDAEMAIVGHVRARD